MKVDLPDGNSATLRDPRTMPSKFADIIADAQTDVLFSGAGEVFGGAKDKATAKALQDEFDALSAAEQMRRFGRDGVKALRDYSRAVVLALVAEWSFGPVDQETLTDVVPSDALTLLEAECTKVMNATGGTGLDTNPPVATIGEALPETPSQPSSD
jgi:hypothetical protein